MPMPGITVGCIATNEYDEDRQSTDAVSQFEQ